MSRHCNTRHADADRARQTGRFATDHAPRSTNGLPRSDRPRHARARCPAKARGGPRASLFDDRRGRSLWTTQQPAIPVSPERMIRRHDRHSDLAGMANISSFLRRAGLILLGSRLHRLRPAILRIGSATLVLDRLVHLIGHRISPFPSPTATRPPEPKAAHQPAGFHAENRPRSYARSFLATKRCRARPSSQHRKISQPSGHLPKEGSSRQPADAHHPQPAIPDYAPFSAGHSAAPAPPHSASIRRSRSTTALCAL